MLFHVINAGNHVKMAKYTFKQCFCCGKPLRNWPPHLEYTNIVVLLNDSCGWRGGNILVSINITIITSDQYYQQNPLVST